MRSLLLLPLIIVLAGTALDATPVLTPGSDASLMAPFGADEFGRNHMIVLLRATGQSVVFGVGLALLAVMVAVPIAYLVSRRPEHPLVLVLLAMLHILESIPIVMWVLVAVAVLPGWRASMMSGAFLIAVSPFAVNVIAGELTRLQGMPFVQAARLAGVTEFQIMWRHLLPNAAASFVPLLVQLTGIATTLPGAIGILGYGNRSEYNLGVILMRGKENVAENPLILLSGVVALAALYVYYEVLRRAWSRNPPSS